MRKELNTKTSSTSRFALPLGENGREVNKVQTQKEEKGKKEENGQAPGEE